MTGEVVDLTDQLGPVRDQGARGTCLAFAATAAHEVARRAQRGAPGEDLSEEFLYWACKQVDGNPEAGTDPDTLRAALHNPGQPAAEIWAYDPDRDEQAGYRPPVAALARDVLRRGRLATIACNGHAVKDAVRSGDVVILGLELWDGFFSAGIDVISPPEPRELIGDLHAVAVVGFDETGLLLRNSWGTDEWGDSGHGRLAEDALPVVGIGAWRVVDDIDP
jgi:hypothetical protein